MNSDATRTVRQDHDQTRTIISWPRWDQDSEPTVSRCLDTKSVSQDFQSVTVYYCKTPWWLRLFVCPPAYLENHAAEFHQIFVHVACGCGSVLLWYCNTLCTSGFLGDVMFSYSGANGPESSTTLCLEEDGGTSWTSSTVFGRVHQNAALEAKSAIYDW